MTDRIFDPIRLNGRAYGVRITCGNCGAFAELPTASGNSHMPPEVVAKHIKQKGWRLGSSSRKDRCPDCIALERQSKPKPTIIITKTGEIETMTRSESRPDLSLVPPASIRGASEQPPRTMEREDRRIVFAKLEEIYLNEREGYSPGWNDERVAKDLGVPRHWVETIRDENFGPQKSATSAEIIAIDLEIEALEREGTALASEAATIRRQAQAAVEAAASIEGRSHDLLKACEKLRADLGKLIGRK